MAGEVNHRRKEILESCDKHLFVAIDRLFTIWADICRMHPELGHHLVIMMTGIEQQRFMLQQWYHLCWGGRPGWMLGMSEIVHRLRQQRAEWATEVQQCRAFGSALEDTEPK